MKELLKNLVASIPLGIALLVSYTTKPILYVAQKFTLLGIFLHENLETRMGKEITAKKAEIMRAVEMMKNLKEKMEATQTQGGEPGDDRLANLVKGNNSEGQTPSNVFILKKDDGNKT